MTAGSHGGKCLAVQEVKESRGERFAPAVTLRNLVTR